MQKKYLPVSLMAILGAAAAFMRKIYIENDMTGDGGFAVKNSAVGNIVLIISACAVICALICAVWVTHGGAKKVKYSRAFYSESAFFTVLAMIAGVAVMAAAVIFDVDIGLAQDGVSYKVLRIFAICTGLSISTLALAQGVHRYGMHIGLTGVVLYLMSVVPVLFGCMCLAVCYKVNASNPARSEYMYSVLAIAALSASANYSAGFIYGCTAPRAAVATNLAALYFSVLILPDEKEFALQAMLIAVIVFVAVSSARLCGGLSVPEEEEESAEEAETDTPAEPTNGGDADN